MKLYKFRSLKDSAWVEEILTTKKFHMARWEDLNDPMEGFYSYINYYTYDKFRNLVDQFKTEKKELKICCFSHVLKQILLWSNYADQHKGIAIEITVDKIKESNLHKVRYVKNIPELDLESKPNPLDVLTNKINIWSYEKEYRFISNNEVSNFSNITAIYFGVRTEEDNKTRIANLVRGTIQLYETKIDFDKNKVLSANELYI